MKLAPAHTCKAACAVFNISVCRVDDVDFVLRALVISARKGAGYVHGVAFIPFEAFVIFISRGALCSASPFLSSMSRPLRSSRSFAQGALY